MPFIYNYLDVFKNYVYYSMTKHFNVLLSSGLDIIKSHQQIQQLQSNINIQIIQVILSEAVPF